MNDHLKNEQPPKKRPSTPTKPAAKKSPKRRKPTPKPPVMPVDDGRDLRHVRSREDNVDELRRARMLARQRRRRKLMITRMLIVLSIVLIVVLIAFAVGIKVTADQKYAKRQPVKFLAVKEIVVEGDTRYTDKEIIDASTLYVGQSLLSVNKSDAGKALVNNLPYLDGNKVAVDNASFYTLRIRVEEVEVAAAVQMDKDWMIMGVNNRAMELVKESEIPDDVVRVEGASFENKTVGKTLLDERSLRICRTLVEAASRYDLKGMTTIDMRTKSKICIRLDERIEVVLGNETNLENQIKALVKTLPTLYQNNGEDAAGRLNMIFYSDDDKSNDKSIYTPQEVLDKLEQAQNKPMAAVQTGEDWTIINEDNLVLETVPEEHIPANVVRVVGAKTEAVVVGKELLDVRSLYICHTIIQEANSLDGVHLKAVDITDQTAITLELKEGLRVLLGDSTALEAQMEALEDVLPIVWNDHGKKADGLLDITGYGDDNPDNDKPLYNPATN